MNLRHESFIDEGALSGCTGDAYSKSCSIDFLERVRQEAEYLDNRLAFGLDPYQAYTDGLISTRTKRSVRDGILRTGINFGSQDYLSLSSHPQMPEAVKNSVDQFGVHSAGSAALAGITRSSLVLERELSDFLNVEDCTLFPIGWAAGYGVIKSLIRPDDHVVIDVLAHACLQEGADAATKNVHRFPHLSNNAVERRLKRIRLEHPNAGVLVVTESLFSMDSDVPDIRTLQQLCHAYEATLVLDVAHDLGAIGPSGLGFAETQEMVGKVDIVMGSFSKTFAAIGGFVACNEPGLKIRLRAACGPSTFTNAMSPLQTVVIRKALEIIRSTEGEDRRANLMGNVDHVRTRLQEEGFEVLGEPSPIVPVILGDPSISRLATKYANELGGFVNLVEYPAVSKNTCRWRIQVMADHTNKDIEEFVDIVVEARKRAQEYLGR